MRFRKKPVEIDAWPIGSFLHGTPGSRGLAFMPDPVQEEHEAGRIVWDEKKGKLLIWTLEGVHEANADDVLIRGIQGEFYACKPDIFDATYEPVDAV